MRIVANVTTDSREKYLPVVKIFPDFSERLSWQRWDSAINDIKDGIKIKEIEIIK